MTPFLKPRRSRRSAPRTRTGCRVCRIRRKKCDEGRPACSGCVRNGLLCSFATEDGDAGRDYYPKSSHKTLKVLDCQQARAPLLEEGKAKDPWRNQPLPPLNPCSISIYAPWDKDRISLLLFEHYSRKTANRICGLLDPTNPFITCILPLAHTDQLVMHSVLALSGAHMIYRTQNENLRSATWIHYGLAIRGLKESLTSVNRRVLDEAEAAKMLALTLMLCHVEVCL
jgi:hypothetical protein